MAGRGVTETGVLTPTGGSAIDGTSSRSTMVVALKDGVAVLVEVTTWFGAGVGVRVGLGDGVFDDPGVFVDVGVGVQVSVAVGV